MGARSLQTQQQGLEVTGHNLANVNNPAYARQRLEIQTKTGALAKYMADNKRKFLEKDE